MERRLKLLFLTTVKNEDGKESLVHMESVETDDERCKQVGKGAFTIKLGDMEYAGHADVVFTATLPKGGIRWSAGWDTKDGVANGVASGKFESSGPQITDLLNLPEALEAARGPPR